MSDKTLDSAAQSQAEFAAHIRNPDKNPAPANIEARRLKIYRDLIFRNVESFLTGSFPVLTTLYSEDNWQALVQDFLENYVCHSPYFTEISQEFLNFLNTSRDLSQDPPFILELAHYEWIELCLAIDETEQNAVTPGANIETAIPVPNQYLQSLVYQFPVHRIGQGFQPQQAPEEATYLLVYRDCSEQIKFVQFNAMSSALMAAIVQNFEQGLGLSGQALVLQLLADLPEAQQQNALNFALQQMHQWQQQGILIGACDI